MKSSTQPRRFWTPARLALTFVTLALVISSFVASCTSTNNGNANNSNSGQPPAKTANNPNNLAPPATPLPAETMNAELIALDGSKFKLSDYQGKILLVNLWATWCGPCRSEVPDLVKVSEEYKAKGVEIIGLTSEDPELDAEKVKAFVKKFNINYRIGWSNQQFAMDLMQGQVRNSIPQSFLIARDGRVLKRFVGFSPVETPPKLRQALEDAVNNKG